MSLSSQELETPEISTHPPWRPSTSSKNEVRTDPPAIFETGAKGRQRGKGEGRDGTYD